MRMSEARAVPVTKERLKRYYYLMIELENQIDRAAKARAKLESPSTATDGMPHSNYAVDRMANGVARVITLERIRDAGIERIKEETAALEEAIQLLDDPCERELLRLRYLDIRDWDEICSDLHFESTKVYSIHGDALQHIFHKTNPWPQN